MSFNTSLVDDMFSDEQPEDFKEPIPMLENGWGSYGDFQLVGNGKVTNDRCGSFRKFYGCLRVHLHNRMTLDGKDYSGKVYIKPVFHSCDKPSCPICFKRGWASREAHSIEARLTENGKYGKGFGRWGLVEHIVATVPPKFYGLSLEALRKKIKEILYARGVIGGVMIFHGFRYNKRKYWYWSPHFHVLGFIRGGYKCRNCKYKWDCLKGLKRDCDGYCVREFECFQKDGCIVKVMGKRKTVGGTAWYQLNHAAIQKGKKRFHVATWFGVCSYRKLKVTVERMKSVCPLCRHDLVEVSYVGSKFDKWFFLYCGASWVSFMEEGFFGLRRAWVEVVRISSSYG